MLAGFLEIEGLVVVRANVDPSGAVVAVDVIVDLLAPAQEESSRQAALDSIRHFLETMTFDDVTGASRITLPIRLPLTPPASRPEPSS